MVRSYPALAFALVAVLTGCPKGGGDAASDAAAISVADAGTDVTAGEAVEDDEIRAVYPADAGPPDPLVRKLCGALHELPEQRRSACCAASPSVVLTGECTRTLTAALGWSAVTLAATDVDACEQAMQKAFEGCEWIGPFAPEVPAACLGIVKGQIKSGKRCRSSLECAADMRCHGVGPTTTGRCAPPKASGEKCGGTADTLAGYARQNDLDARHPECKGWCERTKCADIVPAGGPCSLGAACGAGHLCVAGKCAAAVPAKIGEACPGDACEKGAQCIQGKCVPRKPAGAACASDFECLGGCLKGDAGGKGTCGKKCSAR